MISLNYPGKKTEEELNLILSTCKKELPIINGNMLIQGDNEEAMFLLLKNYAGKIDLIYTDPPFNTDQVFYSGNGRASTISNTKDSAVAYSDNLPKEDFLEFIYERLILMRGLLSENGSIYLHIDYKIGHYIKILMDEVFGEKNFKNDLTRIKSNPKNFQRKAYGNEKDLILFYSKNSKKNIWNDITEEITDDQSIKRFKMVESDGRRYTTIPLHAPGESKNGETSKPWRGMLPPKGRHWRTSPEEFDKLDAEGRIQWSSTGNPRIKKYASEHKGDKIQDVWVFKDPQYPIYPTEKNHDLLKRIIMQSSHRGSIVMDCFAGGGTTLKVAGELGRTWIGIDQSDVSIETIKSVGFDNYSLINLADMSVETVVYDKPATTIEESDPTNKRKKHTKETKEDKKQSTLDDV